MKRTRNTKVAFFTIGMTVLCGALPFAMQAGDFSFFNLILSANGSESGHSLEYKTLATTAQTDEGNDVSFTYSGVTEEDGMMKFSYGGYIETSGLNALTVLEYSIDYGRATVEYGFPNTTTSKTQSLYFDEFDGYQTTGTLTLNTSLGGANYIRIYNNEPEIELRIKALRFRYNCNQNSYVAPSLTATINGTSYNATEGADIDGIGHLGLRYNSTVQAVVPTLDLLSSVAADVSVTTNENSYVALRAPRGGTSMSNLTVSGNTGNVILEGYNHNSEFGILFNGKAISTSAKEFVVNTPVSFASDSQNDLTAINITDGRVTLNDNVSINNYQKAVQLTSVTLEDEGIHGLVQNENVSFAATNVLLGIYVETSYTYNNGIIILKGNTNITATSYEAMASRDVTLQVLSGTHVWESTGSISVKVGSLQLGLADVEGFTANLKVINNQTNGTAIQFADDSSLNTINLQRGKLSIVGKNSDRGDNSAIKFNNGYTDGTTVVVGNDALLGFKDWARMFNFEPNVYYGPFNADNINADKVKSNNIGDKAWYSANKPTTADLDWQTYDSLFNF